MRIPNRRSPLNNSIDTTILWQCLQGNSFLPNMFLHIIWQKTQLVQYNTVISSNSITSERRHTEIVRANRLTLVALLFVLWFLLLLICISFNIFASCLKLFPANPSGLACSLSSSTLTLPVSMFSSSSSETSATFWIVDSFIAEYFLGVNWVGRGNCWKYMRLINKTNRVNSRD